VANDKMVAFCGIVCTECPAYIATQKNDDELREKVAQKWSSDEYPIKMKDVNCYGCVVEDNDVMDFCSECEVRKCGIEKGVKNCAYCDDYICEKLEKLWKFLNLPKPKQELEKIRKARRMT
jgi:hypothetical protein